MPLAKMKCAIWLPLGPEHNTNSGGCSRYIVHHELPLTIQEYDVQVTLEREP